MAPRTVPRSAFDLVVALLRDTVSSIGLDVPFQEALRYHARRAMEGKRSAERFKDDWRLLPRALKPHCIRSLQAGILEDAQKAEGRIAESFFHLYGDLLSDKELLRRDSRATPG